MSAADWFGEEFEITPGNPAGYMVYAQELGMSAREALDAWRELGGTAGNQNWHSMYGQIADTLARTPDMAALDPNVLPAASDYGTWAFGNGGQYATQVKVLVTDTETGLQSWRDFTHITDEPHTPAEAIAEGIEQYGSDDNETAYGETVGGGFVVHIWQSVPYDLAG